MIAPGTQSPGGVVDAETPAFTGSQFYYFTHTVIDVYGGGQPIIIQVDSELVIRPFRSGKGEVKQSFLGYFVVVDHGVVAIKGTDIGRVPDQAFLPVVQCELYPDVVLTGHDPADPFAPGNFHAD